MVKTSKIYDDSLVVVYNDNGVVEYKGIYDECQYKDEDMRWNEKEQCYNLPYGYKMEVYDEA